MRVNFVMVVAVLAVVASCKKKPGEPTPEGVEKNKACDEALASGQTAEARAWLDPAHQDHLGFEVGKEEMRELAEAFYAAGATKVHVDYSELEGKQISSTFVVELPASDREKVFAQHAAIKDRFELDTETDVGQKCLIVGLD
jgi:hypothetical protein